VSEYNLGTARGQISIDGSAGAAGFKVAESAAQSMFDAISNKIKDVQQLGRRIAAVGAAGVAGFGVAIKSASGFEAQIDAIAAVSGSAGKELDAIRDKALQLGADTSFSAGEAASALEELIKAGVSVKDVLNGAADATTALAAAGGLGIPEAATIAANAMNQFGISGSEAAHVADVLAGAANASSADVSSLGQSLSQTGAVANLAGLSLDDTVKALGQLSSKGIEGSDAGTSLKTMLSNLVPATAQQITKFQELGLMTYKADRAFRILRANGIEPTGNSLAEVRTAVADYLVETQGLEKGSAKLAGATEKWIQKQGVLNNHFFDAKGNVKDLRGIQDALAKSTEYLADGTTKMTKEEKLKNIEILFGSDAMRAAAILAEQGAAGYDKFSKSMEGITAADVAKKRLDNLNGAVEQLKGAAETLAIKIGTPLLGPLTKAVKTIANVVSNIGKLPDPVLKVISIVGAIVSVFLLVSGAALALIPVIAALVVQWALMRVVKSVIGPIFTFVKSLIMSRNASTAATAAQARLNASWIAGTRIAKLTSAAIRVMAVAVRVLSFAFSGPGLAIIALIAILVILYKKNEAFRDLVNKVGAAIKTFLIASFERAKVVIQQLADYFQKLAGIFKSEVLPVIKQVGAELLGKIVAGARTLWNQINAQLVPALMKLIGVFKGLGSSSFGQKMAEWGGKAKELGAAILPVLAKIGEMFVGKVLPILVKVAGFFGGVLIDTVVSAISGIIKVITGLVTMITGVFNFFKGLFTGDWALMWEGVKQIFSGALTAIVGAVQTYLAVGLLKVFRLGFSLITGVIRAGWTIIATVFRTAGSLLLNLVLLPFKLILAVIRLHINLFRAIISAGLNLIKSIFSKVFGGLGGVVGGAMSRVRGLISAAVGAVKSLVSGGFGALRGIVSSAMGRVVGAITGTLGRIKSAVGSIKSAITGAISSLPGTMLAKGKEIIGMLAQGILSGIDKIKGAMGKVGKIAGKFIPGSPVREGALRSLNNGHAGGLIATMLADGINRKADAVKKAMVNISRMAQADGVDVAVAASATYAGIAGSRAGAASVAPTATLPGTVSSPSRAAAVTRTANGETTMQLVKGELDITPEGKAFIRGQAREVSAEESSFDNLLNKMAGAGSAY
jgi:phage-related protein